MNNGLSELIKAETQPGAAELNAMGSKIGQLYTDMGFPIDMALDRLEGYTKLQKLSILDGACEWLIEHKRNSGATEKAIARQRKANRTTVERFIKTGETGVY